MGLINWWEIKSIAARVGENSKKINSIIDITQIHYEHLENFQMATDKLSNIVTAMLQSNPAQLINNISCTLEMGHEAQILITNLVKQAKKDLQ